MKNKKVKILNLISALEKHPLEGEAKFLLEELKKIAHRPKNMPEKLKIYIETDDDFFIDGKSTVEKTISVKKGESYYQTLMNYLNSLNVDNKNRYYEDFMSFMKLDLVKKINETGTLYTGGNFVIKTELIKEEKSIQIGSLKVELT